MNIPPWTETPDYFVWEAFDFASRDRRRTLEPDANQQEALLADTTSFYVVPDQFGVVSGHLLVIPKRHATSIACLGPAMDDEINWLLESVSSVVALAYKSQVVMAEHGDCGCMTANQAHVHVLPVPRALTQPRLQAIIDEVLQRRMVGIEHVAYRGADFSALEDIRALINAEGASITGRQLRFSDLPDDGAYPASARIISNLEQPYVYFVGPGVRFLSACSFRSQFVREVVSIATSQPQGTWNRRVHNDRSNMFKTFARLGPAFERFDATRYDFRGRAQR